MLNNFFHSCAPKLLISVAVSEEDDAWDFQVVLSAGLLLPVFIPAEFLVINYAILLQF